jgi:hypothetical protein
MSGLESIEEEGGVEPTERVQTEQVLLLLGWKMREKRKTELIKLNNNLRGTSKGSATSFAVYS